MKKAIILLVFVALVLFVSGCIGDNLCREVEKKAAEKNITCKCVPTDFLPKEYENISAKPRCTCLCYSQGVWINTTIAIAEDDSTSEALNVP